MQDLGAINATMVDMGALQPGLPSPVAVPKGLNIIVIDLQDCLFTIKLHPEDCKKKKMLLVYQIYHIDINKKYYRKE